MLNAKRVTELNNQSVSLSKNELQFVEKFSVSLPMNELPEIVVVGEQPKPTGTTVSTSTIRKTHEDLPAVIPFTGRVKSTDDDESVVVPTRATDESQIPEIELPVDELDINENVASESFDSVDDDADDAVFCIEDFNEHQNRFEKIAKNVEAKLEYHANQVVLFTAPSRSPHQASSVFNILTLLANRNPTLRIISVQAESCAPDEEGRFSLGLGHVLSQKNQLDEVVIPTTIENLDYLAFSDCSSVSANSFDDRAAKILNELKKHYDLVVLNAKQAHDQETKSWAGLADATYLLVKLNSDPEELAVEAATELRKTGARLVGCIVTEDE